MADPIHAVVIAHFNGPNIRSARSGWKRSLAFVAGHAQGSVSAHGKPLIKDGRPFLQS